MSEYSISSWMLAHPWVAVVVAFVVLVILLLPYEVMHLARSGNIYVRCRALLWSWERGPNRTRLVLRGLLRLQLALLKIIQWIWTQYRDRLWAGVCQMIKVWLG